MPGVAQTGSTAFQGVAHGAGHGLLATLPAKIIAGVLAVVVVAGGAAAALAATGTKLPIFGSSSGSQPSGAHPTSTTGKSSPAASAPNGAPPDSATFTLNLTLPGATVELPNNPEKMLLVMGGKVCGPHDTGQPFTYPDPVNSLTLTYISTCSGTYQNGTLTYTQMILQFSFSGQGATCAWSIVSPWTITFQGAFTSPTSISGTATDTHGAEQATCAGVTSPVNPENETLPWTGTPNTTTTP
jgi:hypothetical protein